MSQLFKTHSVSIKRQTVTNTESASDSKSYTTAARGSLPTSLTCRVVPISARERGMYGMMDQELTHKVYSLTNPQADERDMFVYSSRELFVKAVRNPDELNRYWIVECAENTGAR